MRRLFAEILSSLEHILGLDVADKIMFIIKDNTKDRYNIRTFLRKKYSVHICGRFTSNFFVLYNEQNESALSLRCIRSVQPFFCQSN